VSEGYVCTQIEIKKADADMYVAIIDDKVTVKLGPRYDMGDLAPKEEEVCASTLAQPFADFCLLSKLSPAESQLLPVMNAISTDRRGNLRLLS
jgi:Alpha-amylase C-terminal beta-sheet domain